LIEKLLTFSATRRAEWRDRVFIADARAKAAEIASKKRMDELTAHAKQQTQLSELQSQIQLMDDTYNKQILALTQKIKESEDEAEQFNDDAIQAAKVRDHYIDQNAKLRYQINALTSALAEKSGQKVDASVPIPISFDDMSEWLGKYLIGRLEFTPRAFRDLKRATYSEPSNVYRALLLLANQYRNMRLGDDGAKTQFEDALNQLQLRCGPSITESRAGEQGAMYYTDYPIGSNERRFLELHLRSKGNTRDPSRCLAIYFFWDDDTQQVIVGSLPEHLDNRMT
jgi:hypothetical protein